MATYPSVAPVPKADTSSTPAPSSLPSGTGTDQLMNADPSVAPPLTLAPIEQQAALEHESSLAEYRSKGFPPTPHMHFISSHHRSQPITGVAAVMGEQTPSGTNNDVSNDLKDRSELRKSIRKTCRVLEASVVTAEEPVLRLECGELYNILNQGVHKPFIHDEQYLLILDFRSKSEFVEGSIRTARHYSKSMNTVEDVVDFPQADSFTFAVVYDGTGEGVAEKVACSLKRLRPSSDVMVLRGGYAAFHALYPYMCSTVIIASPTLRSRIVQYPSEIVPGRLFLGNYSQAAHRGIVDDLNLTHIVNVSRNHENKFPSIKYLRLEVDDELDSNLFDRFQEACSFIDEVFALEKSCVLVHCTMGVSRSASVVIAYLMHSRRISCKDSFEFVRERRQGIRPNRAFAKQLCAWEKQLIGSSVTDPFDIF